MKTFFVLFVIAVSLPAEAQRVKENVRQRIEIIDESSVIQEAPVADVKADPKDIKKIKVDKPIDATRKQ